MSWSTSELRVRFAPWNRFKPSSKIFYWPFQGHTSFVDLLCFCSVLCLLCLCARLFICALWSPAGKGLTSWLSFVVSNCEFVTFPLVSWVRCGTWLYQFLIFAPLLTFIWNLSSNGLVYVLMCWWDSNMSGHGWKVKGQPWPFKLFYSYCLIWFNISSENNDFGLNSFQKMKFSKKIPFKCIRKQIWPWR